MFLNLPAENIFKQRLRLYNGKDRDACTISIDRNLKKKKLIFLRFLRCAIPSSWINVVINFVLDLYGGRRGEKRERKRREKTIEPEENLISQSIITRISQ